jgi:hypothetical protein
MRTLAAPSSKQQNRENGEDSAFALSRKKKNLDYFLSIGKWLLLVDIIGCY